MFGSDIMKKIELLAPAGNMECLKAAVMAGCDAVYLGGDHFGARAFSKNFSREEIVTAIKYCHLYGVRVYVTVNTLIYDNEVDDFLNYIEFIHTVHHVTIVMVCILIYLFFTQKSNIYSRVIILIMSIVYLTMQRMQRL